MKPTTEHTNISGPNCGGHKWSQYQFHLQTAVSVVLLYSSTRMSDDGFYNNFTLKQGMFYPPRPCHTHSLLMLGKKNPKQPTNNPTTNKTKKKIGALPHLPSLLGCHIFFYLFSEEVKCPGGKNRYTTSGVQPNTQLWGFLKTDRKVEDFGSLSSESNYNFGDNCVYLKHISTEGGYLCPLHVSRSDTLSTYLKQKLPCITLLCILQKLPFWTNTHTGTSAKTHLILKCLYFSQEKEFSKTMY